MVVSVSCVTPFSHLRSGDSFSQVAGLAEKYPPRVSWFLSPAALISDGEKVIGLNLPRFVSSYSDLQEFQRISDEVRRALNSSTCCRSLGIGRAVTLSCQAATAKAGEVRGPGFSTDGPITLSKKRSCAMTFSCFKSHLFGIHVC